MTFELSLSRHGPPLHRLFCALFAFGLRKIATTGSGAQAGIFFFAAISDATAGASQSAFRSLG